jgi:hypothetical protein
LKIRNIHAVMVDIKNREQNCWANSAIFSCVIIQQVIDSSSDRLNLFQRFLLQ